MFSKVVPHSHDYVLLKRSACSLVCRWYAIASRCLLSERYIETTIIAVKLCSVVCHKIFRDSMRDYTDMQE